MANEQNNQAQGQQQQEQQKPVLTVDMLEAFYGGIVQDEKQAQEILANSTKARLPGLYDAFSNTSEADFKLTTKQWKEKHKADRSSAVRISECTALFYALRRCNMRFDDKGYHTAVSMARDALKEAGFRSNGDPAVSDEDKEFNKIKNAKARARKELEQELGRAYHTMDDEELAKRLKVRVGLILNPSKVPLQDIADVEVKEQGAVHAMEHIEALAHALGANVRHEDGRIIVELDEAAIREEQEEKKEEQKQ